MERAKKSIYIYYYPNEKDIFTGTWTLRIKASDRLTGLQIAEFDEYSKFESMYFAPSNNYTNLIEFVAQETRTEIIQDTKLKENQYIVFKCQNSTNSSMYNYGKIYHPFTYGWNRKEEKNMVHFLSYYNITPDDRNLEFDPQQNLIKTYDKHGRDISADFKP